MEDRRAEFVEQLLNGKDYVSAPADSVNKMDSSREKSQQKPLVEEKEHSANVFVGPKYERKTKLSQFYCMDWNNICR